MTRFFLCLENVSLVFIIIFPICKLIVYKDNCKVNIFVIRNECKHWKLNLLKLKKNNNVYLKLKNSTQIIGTGLGIQKKLFQCWDVHH